MQHQNVTVSHILLSEQTPVVGPHWPLQAGAQIKDSVSSVRGEDSPQSPKRDGRRIAAGLRTHAGYSICAW